MVGKYKVISSSLTSEHAGEPNKNGMFKVISTNRVIKPNEVVTDSYLVLFSADTETEAINYLKYLRTRFYRFLLLQAVTSIHLSKDKFMFIPVQDFTSGSDINWNVGIEEVDMQLFKKYSFDASEILFIDQTIVPILHEEYY
ncbi:hypothetical protein [Enterococcus faecium]